MKAKHPALQELLDLSDQLMQKKIAISLLSHNPQSKGRLFLKEIMTIKVIGSHPGINVSEVAGLMGITRGAVSQTVAKLVRKKMVRKTFAEDNAKEVILQLTDAGWTVFQEREKRINGLIERAQKSLGDDFEPQLNMLISVMTTINKLLASYIAETDK